MKKLLLSLLISLFTTLLFAQSPEENLRKDFNAYIGFTVKKDFRKAAEYIVDDFYKIVPKEQMIKQFEQAFNTPGLVLKLENPKILQVGKPEKINEKHYSIIKYSNLLKVQLVPTNKDEKEEVLKRKAELIKASVGRQSGVESIKYDEKTYTIEAKVIEKICGVSANGQDQWQFVKLDKQIVPILKQFMPKEILDKM